MKIRYFFIVLFLFGIFSCSENIDEKSLHLISETEAEYAPDSRTGIFKIEIIEENPPILKGETNLAEAKLALLAAFEDADINVLDKITILPDTSVGEQAFALINVSVANLRGSHGHSAELVTQTLLGTPVNVLKEENDWSLIQTPDKYIAWTNSGSLERINQSQYDSWKNAKKIIYLNTYGFSFNPESSERIADLVAGNILILENTTEDFWEVIYPDGRKAIISKNEARELQEWNDNISISDNSIIEAAKELIGIPYLWGGTSTKALDCSGFTKTVYFLHGFVIPRDASQQVRIGELIDTEKNFLKLEVGDLLFFGRKNEDQSERVVHVGLWLGNNQFIHASGDVHISSMDSLDENFDSYNYERYLRTKRIIGTNSGLENIISQLYQ